MRTTLWTLFLLFLVVAALGTYGWRSLHQPLDARAGETIVKIPKGASVRQVERLLVTEGLLGSRIPWSWWARLNGQDTRIRSGTYALSAASTPIELLEILVKGETISVAVTIPEGLLEEQVLARLAEGLGLLPADLEAAAREQARRLQGPEGDSASLEGYLFPETYHFDHETPAAEVVERLVSSTFDAFAQAERAQARAVGMSIHEVLTLASIIEAETAQEQERPRVSAVYHNRIARGMLLQADPTVAYATGRIGQPLWYEHLEVDSPYNTYRYAGLPPGPINSPGRACIEAALFPLEDCVDLYFVAQGDGTHLFSRTLREHENAKRRVRQLR